MSGPSALYVVDEVGGDIKRLDLGFGERWRIGVTRVFAPEVPSSHSEPAGWRFVRFDALKPD